MAIEVKTTGMLLDELVTSNLKLLGPKSNSDIIIRHDELVEVVQRRLDVSELVTATIVLAVVDSLCFFAQDQIMDKANSDEQVAKHARDAQYFNALRNAAIRNIDRILGENGSPTEKTYGGN